jgi:GTP-binding protein
VAFVGRSNVGKSSLINALVGNKSLVKVSNKPGKTTEINFFRISGKLYLVDLPGYGYAQVTPEQKASLQKLILWYLTASEVHPNMVVLVIDAKVGVTAFDRQMIEILREENHPFLVAANKADKLSQKDLRQQIARISAEAECPVIETSATVPQGARALRIALGF